MRKKYLKVALFILYFVAAGILSQFLPDQIRFAIGFIFACVSAWAWKVISSERHCKEFTGCECKGEERHGETSVMCCNHCGKPTEEFWTGADPQRGRRKYVREHREFVRVNTASRELQSLKDWWSRLQADVVSDDYIETARTIQEKVLKLHEEYPMVVTVDDCEFFNIFLAVREDGKGVHNG